MTNPQPKSILVVNLRYFGDALISASMVARLRKAWPKAHIAWLTYRRTTTILEGVEGIDEVIGVDEHPSRIRELTVLKNLWNRFDLAFVTQPSSHPLIYGWAASKQCIGFNKSRGFGRFWKGILLSKSVNEGGANIIMMFDRLLDAVGLTPVDNWTVPAPGAGCIPPDCLKSVVSVPYVVLHPKSRCTYKDWTLEGWSSLVRAFNERGVSVVISGGPGAKEEGYAQEIVAAGGQCVSVAGKLSFAQTADLIRGAIGFVGPDTATTHVAAATGRPVVALFGSSIISVWGPWAPGQSDPWHNDCTEPLQQNGNVIVISLKPYGKKCPCGLKGCNNCNESTADCLTAITPEMVMQAFDRVSKSPPNSQSNDP